MSPSLSERLRTTPVPDEEAARRRAWAVAQAALAERPPLRARRRAARVLAPATAAVVLTLAVTPPGSAVADWVADQVRDVVGTAPAPAPRPVAGGVPAGRLLLVRPDGPVIAEAGGRHRLLGLVDDATWSPRGLYVAAARGPELIVVDTRGRRVWSVVARHRVADPRWSPSGFRIAYLTRARTAAHAAHRGWTVRVVAGDGSGDRRLAAAARVAPAWRPGATSSPHQLAYADAAGRVVLRGADGGAPRWRSRPLAPVALAWSADGRRLLAVARDRAYLLDDAGAVLRTIPAPEGTENAAAAFAPAGRRYALVRRTLATGESRVLIARAGTRRFLFAAPGPTHGLAWSPDGRWIAVGVPRARAVVLLRPGRDGLAAARSVVAPGGRLAGWR